MKIDNSKRNRDIFDAIILRGQKIKEISLLYDRSPTAITNIVAREAVRRSIIPKFEYDQRPPSVTTVLKGYFRNWP